MDMVRAGLGLYDSHALLLTQFAQYYPYVLLDPSIYLHPAIFGRKLYMILAPPRCMLSTTYVFILFHGEGLLDFVSLVGKP